MQLHESVCSVLDDDDDDDDNGAVARALRVRDINSFGVILLWERNISLPLQRTEAGAIIIRPRIAVAARRFKVLYLQPAFKLSRSHSENIRVPLKLDFHYCLTPPFGTARQWKSV